MAGIEKASPAVIQNFPELNFHTTFFHYSEENHKVKAQHIYSRSLWRVSAWDTDTKCCICGKKFTLPDSDMQICQVFHE